ncbi:Dihydrolipoamide acetyltransferase [Minicystis rosea]|nr:Dihydrolipoamide acetyltransferase [Minicystis rosea]
MILMPRGRHFAWAAVLALFTATITGTRSARADDVAAAQIFADEGNRAAATGDFTTALDRFRAAYARYRSANILLNIGTTLQRLGRGPEAAVVYEQYLRDPGANPQRIPEIQRAIATIDATIARITIGVSDGGARVWLDGRELTGFAPGSSLRLAPGEHTVAAGREVPYATETIRVSAGEARSVYLRLPMAAVIPAVPAVPTAEPMEAPPRRSSRELSTEGAIALTFDIVGSLGVIGGIAAGIVAIVKNHDASDHCLDRGAACEPRALELESQAKKAGQVGSVLLGAGAAFVVTGAIVHAVDRGSKRRGATSGPRMAVGPGFVTFGGSW